MSTQQDGFNRTLLGLVFLDDLGFFGGTWYVLLDRVQELTLDAIYRLLLLHVFDVLIMEVSPIIILKARQQVWLLLDLLATIHDQIDSLQVDLGTGAL